MSSLEPLSPLEVACDARSHELSDDASLTAMQNRWAEMETTTRELEQERDSLKAESLHLRRTNMALSEASSSAKAAEADNEELRMLRVRFDEVQQHCQANLQSLVKEQEGKKKISEELQEKAAALAVQIETNRKLQAQTAEAEAEMLNLRQDAARLQQVQAGADLSAQRAAAQIEELTAERNRLFHERAAESQVLTAKAAAVGEEAARLSKEAETSRELLQLVQQQAADAERRLQGKVEHFESDRAALENQLKLKGEQQKREGELMKGAKSQLAQVASERTTAQEALAKTEAELAKQKERADDFEAKFRFIEKEHATLLQERVPGVPVSVATMPPAGVPCMSELLSQVTHVRAEALAERQAREDLQADVDRLEGEVNTNAPRLQQQEAEVVRLREANEALTRSKAEMTQKIRELSECKEAAEARAEKAEQQAELLEKHARDMGKQLGLLVDENRRLADGESADGLLASAKDLAVQNESLRRSVARLTSECETAAQRELQAVRDEQEDQAKKWREQLAERDHQLSALMGDRERVARERDEALAKLQEHDARRQLRSPRPAALPAGTEPAALSSAPAEADEGTQQAEREAKLRVQLQAVQEEFSKCAQKLHQEVRELRESELSWRRQFATVAGKLDYELSQRASLESERELAMKRLQEHKEQLAATEKQLAMLQETSGKDYEAARDLEVELNNATRRVGQLESQLRSEKFKVSVLEESSDKLLAEKASQAQVQVELQVRLAQETEAYRDKRKTMEESYLKEGNLIREQLEISQARQTDQMQILAKVESALATAQGEASDAKKKAVTLEASVSALQIQLAQRAEEVQALQAAGAARPRQKPEISADIQAQLDSALKASALKGSTTEKEMKRAKEREGEHKRVVDMWKNMLSNREQDLKSSQVQVSKLEEQLQTEVNKVRELGADVQRAKDQEQKLESRISELTREAGDLKESLQKKDAEVKASREENERNSKEAAQRLEALRAEHARAGNMDGVEEWKKNFNKKVKEHSDSLQQLDCEMAKCQALQRELDELRTTADTSASAASTAESARANLEEEVSAMKERLATVELRSQTLAAELQAHREAGAGSPQAGRTEAQELVAEMGRHTGELCELRQQELEIERSRQQRELQSLRTEVADLQKQLAGERDKTMKLSIEASRGQIMATKLCGLQSLEEENKRLREEIKAGGTMRAGELAQTREVGETRRRESVEVRSGAAVAAKEEAEDEDLSSVVAGLKKQLRTMESFKALHLKKIESLTAKVEQLEGKGVAAAQASGASPRKADAAATKRTASDASPAQAPAGKVPRASEPAASANAAAGGQAASDTAAATSTATGGTSEARGAAGK